MEQTSKNDKGQKMSMSDILNKDFILRDTSVKWDVFSQGIDQSGQKISDLEEPCVHILDFADGHHGAYTFEVAFEMIEGHKPGLPCQSELVFEFEDSTLSRWTEEVALLLGDNGFYVDRFQTDGSISLLYSATFDSSLVEDSFENFLLSVGCPENGEIDECMVEDFILEVKRVCSNMKKERNESV